MGASNICANHKGWDWRIKKSQLSTGSHWLAPNMDRIEPVRVEQVLCQYMEMQEKVVPTTESIHVQHCRMCRKGQYKTLYLEKGHFMAVCLRSNWAAFV